MTVIPDPANLLYWMLTRPAATCASLKKPAKQAAASRRRRGTHEWSRDKEATRRMVMNFEESDETTRRYMLQEFEAELASDKPVLRKESVRSWTRRLPRANEGGDQPGQRRDARGCAKPPRLLEREGALLAQRCSSRTANQRSSSVRATGAHGIQHLVRSSAWQTTDGRRRGALPGVPSCSAPMGICRMRRTRESGFCCSRNLRRAPRTILAGCQRECGVDSLWAQLSSHNSAHSRLTGGSEQGPAPRGLKISADPRVPHASGARHHQWLGP